MLREVQEQLNELDKVVEATPWRDAGMYGAYLAQTYYYVSHSTRLLTLAASRFKVAEEEALHRRFIKHTSEEMSHEVLALRDLKQLGQSVDEYPEFPSTRAFYQTQYYLIEHVSPWAMWGYILMLEGLAVTKGAWLFNELKTHHGEKASSFVKVHATEDISHFEEAEKALEAIPAQELPRVIAEVENSRFHFTNMLAQSTTYAKDAALRGTAAAPALRMRAAGAVQG